jgi:polysaccharide biosynthesis/export protein VpsN
LPEYSFAEPPPGVAATSGASPVAATAMPPASVTTPVAGPITNPAAVPGVTGGGASGVPVLRVGDSLMVTFTDTPAGIPAFDETIKEDGTITLTLNQTFKAAGKSEGDLAKEIRDRYVPRFYKYMTVSVKQQETTRWYYVEGEVRGPSRQIYSSRITVLKAITSAGGFTDFAKKTKVQLTHVDGRTQIVNCKKALRNPSLDPEVYPGDTIHVPRSIW